MVYYSALLHAEEGGQLDGCEGQVSGEGGGGNRRIEGVSPLKAQKHQFNQAKGTELLNNLPPVSTIPTIPITKSERPQNIINTPIPYPYS